MAPKLFELRPDRQLLNPNFNGYKLSLEQIPILRQDLIVPVERVLPNSDQFSLLHAKLFALHNHLFTDQYTDQVYFVDTNWHIQKISVDKVTGRLRVLEQVWGIPERNERKPGHYNISISFPTETRAVLSDGCGVLYILNTGNRNENNGWTVLFSDEVLDGDTSFVVQDAVYLDAANGSIELHCLLVSIERGESDRFQTVVHWVTLKELNDKTWGEVGLRCLKATGGFYYCALEPNCRFIYIASDVPFKFTLDSENPIVDHKPEPKPKVYAWLQTEDDLTIRLNVNSNCDKRDISIQALSASICIKYKDTVLIQGDLAKRIDADLTTWDITGDNILEVHLMKAETGQMWEELVPGDVTGEHIVDPNVVAEIHERLAHLCSETEVIPAETGPSFSTQQIEECDFEGDNTAIFERICGTSHDVTNRSNLGSHQVIMTVKLNATSPTSIVIRHDVDACVWSPQQLPDNDWSLKHEGTLLAFGYVQASKQQRKFTSCSPDLSYSVVCEASRHCFIYRKNRNQTMGELRNRTSGQRIDTVAQQQVIGLEDDEVLGLSASNEVLYLLTEHYLLALKLQCTDNENIL